MKNAKLKSEIFLIVKKSLCLVHDIGAVLCVNKKKLITLTVLLVVRKDRMTHND